MDSGRSPAVRYLLSAICYLLSAVCCLLSSIFMKALRSLLTVALFTTTLALTAQVDSSRYTEMHWRMIGPFRGGRTVAAVGAPQQQGVYYIGVKNGVVGRATDYAYV